MESENIKSPTITDQCLFIYPKDDNKEANARLIAAAPDLLEACKCLQADLQGAIELLDGDVPSCWKQSIAESEAALAKARGKDGE